MFEKVRIESLEKYLDELFENAMITDKRMGNDNVFVFFINNPNYKFYLGVLVCCKMLGLSCESKIVDGKLKHSLF